MALGIEATHLISLWNCWIIQPKAETLSNKVDTTKTLIHKYKREQLHQYIRCKPYIYQHIVYRNTKVVWSMNDALGINNAVIFSHLTSDYSADKRYYVATCNYNAFDKKLTLDFDCKQLSLYRVSQIISSHECKWE